MDKFSVTYRADGKSSTVWGEYESNEEGPGNIRVLSWPQSDDVLYGGDADDIEDGACAALHEAYGLWADK